MNIQPCLASGTPDTHVERYKLCTKKIADYVHQVSETWYHQRSSPLRNTCDFFSSHDQNTPWICFSYIQYDILALPPFDDRCASRSMVDDASLLVLDIAADVCCCFLLGGGWSLVNCFVRTCYLLRVFCFHLVTDTHRPIPVHPFWRVFTLTGITSRWYVVG